MLMEGYQRSYPWWWIEAPSVATVRERLLARLFEVRPSRIVLDGRVTRGRVFRQRRVYAFAASAVAVAFMIVGWLLLGMEQTWGQWVLSAAMLAFGVFAFLGVRKAVVGYVVAITELGLAFGRGSTDVGSVGRHRSCCRRRHLAHAGAAVA
jgi:hypothetical protein